MKTLIALLLLGLAQTVNAECQSYFSISTNCEGTVSLRERPWCDDIGTLKKHIERLEEDCKSMVRRIELMEMQIRNLRPDPPLTQQQREKIRLDVEKMLKR